VKAPARTRTHLELEIGVGPLDILSPVLFYLKRKVVRVEVSLQLFIGVVDAELLKVIGLQVLKAEEIKDRNRL